MGHDGILRSLIILYGAAMLIALVMRRLRQPVLVGYLITGIVVGPYGLGWIGDTTEVEVLAEVGVALLLFTIGLELSLKKLWRMKEVVLGSGTLQLAATMLLTVGLLHAAGVGVRESVFWGFLVTASSTAIVMKLLHDRGELDTVHGRLVLGVLLFQDLCVVPMMALLPALSATGAAQALDVLLALAKSLFLVGIIVAGAKYLFPRLLRAIVMVRSREVFVIGVMFFSLGTAYGASKLGLSLALGAFLAGIVLSESEYGHQVMAEILPFRDSFNSLFFISVGMLINIQLVSRNVGDFFSISAILILLKVITGGLSVRLLRFPPRVAVLVGLALGQVGEFSIILLQEGAKLQIITPAAYQNFLAATVFTMMATPLLLQGAPHLADWVARRSDGTPDLAQPPGGHEKIEDHVILCGFGMNGRRMARLLRENELPYVVVEIDAVRVRNARSEGEPVYFGDVANSEILKIAGAQRARTIVFAISDPVVMARAISHARLMNPDLHIVARIKRIEDTAEVLEAGATEVIAEEVEAWTEIAVRVLRLYGMPREAVADQMERFRAEDYEMARILPMPGQPLRHLWKLLPDVDVELFIVAPGSPLEGATLSVIDLRKRSGCAVVAALRMGSVVHNPPGDFRLQGGDQLVLFGAREQIASAVQLLHAYPSGPVSMEAS